MRLYFKVEHLWAWYYENFPNFHTLVILLQVNLTFNNELATMYEGFYEIKNTLIFAWSSIPNIGHYHWLGISIHWLPPNNKEDYLIHTIRHILNFM
jgi:hypothetical protein